MGKTRKFKEEPLIQGANEQVAYRLTTTPWGSNPTNPVCHVMVEGGLHDSKLITTTTCTVVGDVITTGRVQNLLEKTNYKIRIRFNIGTDVFEAYGKIHVD